MASRAEAVERPGAPSAAPRRGVWLRVVSALIAGAFAAPFVYLVVRNLADSGPFWSSLRSGSTLAAFARSVLLAVAVSLSATLIGTGAAWFVARTDIPGRRLWTVVLPLPLVIPSFTGAFVLLAAFAPGGVLQAVLAPAGVDRLPSVSGFAGSYIVLTLFTYPYVYLPATARLLQLPPSLDESARLLGSGGIKAFWRIVLPQARGAILAGGLLVFLYTISDFGVVQLMRYEAVTPLIYATRLFDSATSLALSLQLAALAALVVALERILTRGRPPPGSRGARSFRVGLGRWKAPVTAGLAALVVLALGVPVAVLAWWTARGFLSNSRELGALVADLGVLAAPLFNTSVVSVAAAAVAMVAVLPVAYLATRHRSRLAGVANAVMVAAFALPGLAIALALVFWTIAAPAPLRLVYQSLPLLVFAYVVHFGAMAMRSAQASVATVPAQLEDAARVLGAGRVRRFLLVELPLIAPGLLAGGGLVLLSAMKELPATLLLAPAGFQTLATKIWGATESALFADAAMASLLLIALSGVLTWVLVIRRAESFV